MNKITLAAMSMALCCATGMASAAANPEWKLYCSGEEGAPGALEKFSNAVYVVNEDKKTLLLPDAAKPLPARITAREIVVDEKPRDEGALKGMSIHLRIDRKTGAMEGRSTVTMALGAQAMTTHMTSMGVCKTSPVAAQ